MRRCSRFLGPFPLSPLLQVDWRQHGGKDERYAKAVKMLDKIVSTDDRSDLARSKLNALLPIFVASHDVASTSAAVKYLRESVATPLEPMHYHALLRVFSHNKDKAGSESVLEVMAQRQLTTDEALACYMNTMHLCGGNKRLETLLFVVSSMMRAKVPLCVPATAGENHQGPGSSALDDPESLTFAREYRKPATTPSITSSTRLKSPVLSALLHSVSTSTDGAVAATLVVVWMRAMGVELGEWDYGNYLSALARDTDEFPNIVSLFAFDPAAPRGHITLKTLLARLQAERPTASTSSTAGASTEKGSSGKAATKEKNKKRASDIFATAGGASTALPEVGRFSPMTLFGAMSIPPLKTAVVTPILAAMVQAWEALGLPRDYPIHVGFLNTRFTMHDTLIRQVFDTIHLHKGVGPSRTSPFRVHHLYLLTVASLGHRPEAVLELNHVHRRWQEWTRRYGQDGGSLTVVEESSPPTVHVAALAEWQAKVQGTNGVFSGPRQEAIACRMRALAGARPIETPADVVASELAVIDSMMLRDAASFFLLVPRSLHASVNASYKALVEACKPFSNEMDHLFVWALGLPLMQTPEEVKAGFQQVKAASNFKTVIRSARQMLRSMIGTAMMHPPVNPKFSTSGHAERLKWGKYGESRDMALSLFGSTTHGRDAMKAFFVADNMHAPVRSAEALRRDCQDFMTMFPTVVDTFGTASKTSLPSGPKRFGRPVLKLPSTGTSLVPKYTFDPTVFNRFPAHRMKVPECMPETYDVFPDLLKHMNTLRDRFWLADADTVIRLIRCHLQRLDWEGAAAVVEDSRTYSKMQWTVVMEQDLLRAFEDIGDPMGALCFKMATKLFDGRIALSGEDPKEKRRQAAEKATLDRVKAQTAAAAANAASPVA